MKKLKEKFFRKFSKSRHNLRKDVLFQNHFDRLCGKDEEIVGKQIILHKTIDKKCRLRDCEILFMNDVDLFIDKSKDVETTLCYLGYVNLKEFKLFGKVFWTNRSDIIGKGQIL